VAVTPVAAFTDRATAFFAAPLSVTPIVKVAVLPATTVPDVADCVNAKFKLGTAAAPSSSQAMRRPPIPIRCPGCTAPTRRESSHSRNGVIPRRRRMEWCCAAFNIA